MKRSYNKYNPRCKECERAAQTPKKRIRKSKITDLNHFKWYINRHYGLSFEQYLDMMRKQKGLCAICHLPESRMGGGKRLAVDHCHKTGDIRGLLCHKCNIAIGCLKDNVKNVISAARYLGGGDLVEILMDDLRCEYVEDRI